MKQFFPFIFFLIFLTGSAQNESLFERGNEAYAEGDYERAVELYSEIYDSGEESVALHYNLANAYYKLDRVGPSIYHYEKALQMKPGDEDVLNNLVFARNMTIDSYSSFPDSGFAQLLDARTAFLTAAEWGWIAIVCMFLFVGFFIAYYFSRRTLYKRISFLFGMVFFALAVASAAIGTIKQEVQEGESYGIVFSEEIEVRSEPNSRSAEVFTLHEGTKVKVVEDFQGWYEIELPNGAQGWLREKSIRLL